MKAFKPLQILTLLVFFILLSGFVAYRSGAFETLLKRFSPNPNSYLNGEIPTDTPTTLIDSQRINPTLLPTSKSGLIFKERDNQIDPKIEDSIIKTYKQNQIYQKRIMSSSKSSQIFDPGFDSLSKFKPKSDPFNLRKDTLEHKISSIIY